MDDMSDLLSASADRIFSQLFDSETLSRAEQGASLHAEWETVAEVGFPLILVGEEAGGLGISLADAIAIVRLTGYWGVPLPLVETMFANRLLAAAGFAPDDNKAAVLLPEFHGEMRCVAVENGFKISGAARRVPSVREGRIAVVLPHDGKQVLALISAGEAGRSEGSNVASEPRDDLQIEAVLSADFVGFLPPDMTHDHLSHFGALLRAAAIAGALARTVEFAIGYAAERLQFGKPIGSFQAVQSMLAVAAGQAAAANAAVEVAIRAYGRDEFLLACAVAKGRTSEAAGKVAAIAHQVHGAIGITREHQLHFFTTRLWSWREEYGNEHFWYGRVGAHAARPGSIWPMVTKL